MSDKVKLDPPWNSGAEVAEAVERWHDDRCGLNRYYSQMLVARIRELEAELASVRALGNALRVTKDAREELVCSKCGAGFCGPDCGLRVLK